ncbi:hypothetical protein ACLMAL_36120 (plasmid) [Nocardia sp. CWNU-33]|uniref:hypothetical protein n=1 Tax=Nocardia sp. CWNU-33 TaxID=3392117 RepID=UPI00398E3D2C
MNWSGAGTDHSIVRYRRCDRTDAERSIRGGEAALSPPTTSARPALRNHDILGHQLRDSRIVFGFKARVRKRLDDQFPRSLKRSGGGYVDASTQILSFGAKPSQLCVHLICVVILRE